MPRVRRQNSASFGQITAAAGDILLFYNDPDSNMYLPVAPTKAYPYTNGECKPSGVAKMFIRQRAERSSSGRCRPRSDSVEVSLEFEADGPWV